MAKHWPVAELWKKLRMYDICNQICVRTTKFRAVKIISLTIDAKIFTRENDRQYCMSYYRCKKN